MIVVFQLVNVPIEFDASRRARQKLLAAGLMTQEEDAVVGRVMNAAAWTYVAAVFTSALNPLHGLFPFRLLFEFGERVRTRDWMTAVFRPTHRAGSGNPSPRLFKGVSMLSTATWSPRVSGRSG